jgi:hypothetical protein
MLAGSGRAYRDDGGQPGASLIQGGFGNRPRARDARGRRTARAAAPLLVPLALALTLGVILAVSSGGSQPTHITQTTSSTGRP